jgi:hypothetical protein
LAFGVVLRDVLRTISHLLRHSAWSILLMIRIVGSLEVRLAREVGELVARPVRVDDGDVEVGLVERRVVVAAVPDDDVRFLLGLAEDRLVVDAGVDDVARGDVRLVLLALLDGALVLIEVLDGGEALGTCWARSP